LWIPSRMTETTPREADRIPPPPRRPKQLNALYAASANAGPGAFRPKDILTLAPVFCGFGCIAQSYEVVVEDRVASSRVRGGNGIEEGFRGSRRRRSQMDLPLPLFPRIGDHWCHYFYTDDSSPPPPWFCDDCHHSYLMPDSSMPHHRSRKAYRRVASHTIALKTRGTSS